jgi:tRNA(Ile)-lysidine synthase TilS/MesJ
LQFILFFCKQNSIEFHKNKIREEHFFENQTEQIVHMSESCSSLKYTVALQQVEELAEKKMKSKISNLFFL